MISLPETKYIARRLVMSRALVHGALLSLVFLLGATLRLYDLGAESYWIDETRMIETASANVSAILEHADFGGGRPPVYVLLAHAWIELFGTSEAATRSLSALFGIAALPMLYLVGRQLFGKEVALLSTFLLAVSEFQIYHSQNFRYYSLFVFLTLASFFFLIRALRGGRTLDFALYAAATTLLFFTHGFALFIIAAQNLYVLLCFRRLKGVLLGWSITQALVILPLVPGLFLASSSAVAGTSNPMNWIPQPPLWAPLKSLARFLLPGRQLPSLLTVGTALIFFVVGMLSVHTVGRKPWRRTLAPIPQHIAGLIATRQESLLLLACWLLVPVLAPLVLSMLLEPMYLDRYVIGAAPALYLLLAVGLFQLRRVMPEMVVLGALLILITPGLYEYYVTDTNEQWQEAAMYVQGREEPGDVILFAPGENEALRDAFFWYYRGGRPSCDVEPTRDEALLSRAIASCLEGSDRLWLVMRGQEDRVAPFIAYFLQSDRPGMQLRDEQQLAHISLYLFELAP